MKHISRALLVLSLLAALIFTALPAAAFDGLASDFAFSKLQRKLLDNRTTSSQSLDTADALAVVQFTSDPARTQANLQSFIDSTPDPQAKEGLKQLVQAQPTIIQDIGNALRARYGLNPHDLSDVFATWWISAWQITHGVNDNPSVATAQAVSEQVHAAFLDTSDFENLSEAQRQQIAEALLLQALLMSETASANRNNPAAQTAIAQGVARSALQNGIDLSLFTLTQDGFVPK
ncbi:MAG: DUF6683 family protein [Pseudomonadota bacterium]